MDEKKGKRRERRRDNGATWKVSPAKAGRSNESRCKRDAIKKSSSHAFVRSQPAHELSRFSHTRRFLEKLPSSHTRNHVPSPGCFPSLHRSTVPSPTFVLFTSASVLFSSRSLRSRRRPPPNLAYTYIWSLAARFPNRSRERTIRK